MATARIITGFVAVFYFHKCQTRDYTLLGRAVTTMLYHNNVDDTHKYYLLTVEFGIKTYHAYLEWCEEAKEMLGEENK